jgi:HEAT repeat protein
MDPLDRIEEQLEDPNRSVRVRGIVALGGAAGADAVPLLLRMLRDPDPVVRSQAAIELGETKDPRAIWPLCRALKDDDHSVRDRAQELVAAFGEAAAPALLQLLKAKDSDARWRAAGLLVLLGERAVPQLLPTLESKDARESAAGLYALIEIGEPAVAPLIRLLGAGSAGGRGRSALALGRIGTAAAAGPLIETLRDRDERVSLQAAEALGRIAERDPDPSLRSAIRALRALRRSCVDGSGSARILDEAIRGIQAGTDRLKDLPLPAGAPRPAADLPLPGPAEDAL